MKEGINQQSLVLVRHLATKNNKNGIIMGRQIDAGILEEERELFGEKVKRFKESGNPHFDKSVFISSPMSRCQQTAKLMIEQLGLASEIFINQDFNETDMGEFSGKRGRELRGEYGRLIDDWMYRPESFCFPGGESYVEVKERVREGVNSLIKDYDSVPTIVLVSHVDVLKVILSETLDFPFNNRRYISIPTGSISVIGIFSGEEFRVKKINAF